MTAAALIGLVGLNLLYLAAGAALLWALRGWSSWAETARLAGLSYLIGVALMGTLWSLALVAGIALSPAFLAASFAAVLVVALGAGLRLGRSAPARSPARLTRDGVVGAVGLAATCLFLAALFRAARLSGLYAWDAWSFWVPKAKSIYFFGELDEQLLRSVPNASYPPLIPVLDSAAFHFMGGADVVTLHVQFWFFAAGFVFAAAGLLAERVPAWLLWPSLVLVLVAPRVGDRLLTPQADFLLDYCFVVAALLLLRWLDDGRSWELPAAAVLLAAAALTKREGVMLAGCLLAAALVASARHWRVRWPPLAVTAAAVAVAALPWRAWYAAQEIGSELPPGGLVAGLQADRLGPSLRLSLEVLFDVRLWSLVVLLGCAAIALAALVRAFQPAVFVATLLALVTLGGAWVTWVFTELPVTADESANPIVRYTQAAVLLLAVLTPPLLGAVWNRTRAPA